MSYHENDDLENNRKANEHPLTLHVEELSETLKVLLDCPESEHEMVKMHNKLIDESLVLIKAKLYSALRSDNYLVSMQNAAIIRNHAEFLLLSSNTLKAYQLYDESHIAVFRQEMEEFRELFKAWAQEIKAMDREDFEDPWGLF